MLPGQLRRLRVKDGSLTGWRIDGAVLCSLLASCTAWLRFGFGLAGWLAGWLRFGWLFLGFGLISSGFRFDLVWISHFR